MTTGANEDRMRDRLSEMLMMQDKLNTVVRPGWMKAGLAFHRAIYVETAELLDHLGWKWWKAQEPDMGQARMELVDIWHFGMSWLMVRFGTSDHESEMLLTAVTRRLDDGMRAVPADMSDDDLRAGIDSLMEAAGRNLFDTKAFCVVMAGLGMDFEMLFKGYVGKNVLNEFRQNNGYTDGSYRKDWNGEEDNEVLTRMLSDETADGGLSSRLMGRLSSAYIALPTENVPKAQKPK